MSTVAKVLIVLNLVLAAAFLASAAAFLGYQDHWKAKNEATTKQWQTEVGDLKAQLKTANDKTAEVTRQANEAIADAGAAKKQAADDRAQNDMLREHTKQISGSLTSLTRANEAMQATLSANQALISSLQEARQRLTEAVNAANDAKDAAIRQLNALQVANDSQAKEKEELLQKLGEISKQLQHAEAEVAAFRAKFPGSDVAAEQPPTDTGRVLAVDSGTNVVIVSLGAEDHLKPGFRYIVSRGADYVGTIEITNVEAKKSAARSLRDLQKSPIQIGDMIMPR
jgi:hypothetical protein